MADRKAAAGIASSGFEKSVVADIAAKKLTAKSFEVTLGELVDKELSKTEDEDIFEKEKKAGINTNEQDVFLRVMKDSSVDWERALSLGNCVFAPAVKCSEASTFRAITQEEKRRRVMPEVVEEKEEKGREIIEIS